MEPFGAGTEAGRGRGGGSHLGGSFPPGPAPAAQVQVPEDHDELGPAEAVPQPFHFPGGGPQPPGETLSSSSHGVRGTEKQGRAGPAFHPTVTPNCSASTTPPGQGVPTTVPQPPRLTSPGWHLDLAKLYMQPGLGGHRRDSATLPRPHRTNRKPVQDPPGNVDSGRAGFASPGAPGCPPPAPADHPLHIRGFY